MQAQDLYTGASSMSLACSISARTFVTVHTPGTVCMEVKPHVLRQALAAGGPAGRVDLGAESAPLELARPVGPAELRRHKRDFLRLATQV